MRIETEPHDWTAYHELTPTQQQAGLEWLRSGVGLNYQYSEEDLTFLKIYLATPAQIEELATVLQSAA